MPVTPCPMQSVNNRDLIDPRRTIAASVRVTGGDQPLAGVRLTGAMPKARIFDAMRAINARTLTAPVAIGDVVVHDLMGLGCDVIVTRNVPMTMNHRSEKT